MCHGAQSLVLLERAAGVMADMRASRIKPDRAVWNALITAAGRAGQLQRAFQGLEDMQVGAWLVALPRSAWAQSLTAVRSVQACASVLLRTFDYGGKDTAF